MDKFGFVALDVFVCELLVRLPTHGIDGRQE